MRMESFMDALSKLGDIASKYSNLPPMNLDTHSFVENIVPQTPTIKIDEKSTFAYQMQQQTNQIIEKSNEQIRLLAQQNEQVMRNYEKLESLYALKEQELEEARNEA